MSFAAAKGQRQTAEDWAWGQIRTGQVADFNAKCGRQLDPKEAEGWADSCREITARFVQLVLTDAKRQAAVPHHFVVIEGAHITGTVDLGGFDITDTVGIGSSRIEGEIILDDSRWTRVLSLDGSAVTGNLRAQRMRSLSAVYLRNVAISGYTVLLCSPFQVAGVENLRLPFWRFLRSIAAAEQSRRHGH